MRALAISLALLLFFAKVSAQQIPFNWLCANNATGALNDEGRSVVGYQNNSYVIGSFKSNTISFGAITLTNTFNGTSDIFIVKFTDCGLVVWAKSFGTVNDDQGLAITYDVNGNFYFSGSFNSSSISIGSFTLNNNGGDDFFIAKMDVNGNIIWANSWGGLGNEVPKSIDSEFPQNINLVGDYTSSFTIGTNSLSNAGNEDFFYMQITPTGSIITAKGYGSAGSDKVNCVRGQLMCGIFNSASLTIGASTLVNYNSGTYDSFIINLDGGFNETWVTGFGNSGDDVLNSISVFGSFPRFAGSFNSASLSIGNNTVLNANPGTNDALIVAYNNGGSAYKAVRIGNVGNEEAKSIIRSANNSDIVTGIFDSATLTFSGTVVTLTNTNAGTFDIFTTCTDNLGSFNTARSAGGPGDDVILNNTYYSIFGSGVISYVGSFNGATSSFSPATTLTNTGGTDFFLTRFTDNFVIGSVESQLDSKIKIFPNPINEKLFIQTEEEVKVKIIDVLGKTVFEEKMNGLKEVDFTSQAKGIYLLIVSSDKETMTHKLILE